MEESGRKKLSLPAHLEAVDGDGKKKQSLNHLLNFTLSPRDSHSGSGASSWTGDTRRRRQRLHSYNKEQFLQANCQFVVCDRGDYAVHAVDPDLLVDWDSIELVRLFCHEIPSCPICLYPPQAAKITRCGHVYCYSCVIHYLSLGEKKWRKCPICYESIYKKDLKSVMALATPQYSAGDIITMTLMVREKGYTRVMPSQQESSLPGCLPHMSDPGEKFVKLVSCSSEQSLEHIVLPEKDALTAQLNGLTQDEVTEQCFIELALEDVKARELALRVSSSAQQPLEKAVKAVTPPLATPTTPQPGHCKPVFPGPDMDEEAGERGSDKVEMEDKKRGELEPSTPEHEAADTSSIVSLDMSEEQLPTSSDCSPNGSDSSLTYFYQAADGQHLYLHTVNARCLIKEYGALQHAPAEIKARIVEMEQFSMTEELRCRYKYLSHLPVTCEFVLCELDLRPPVVSCDTLTYFHEDLERRRHRRMKKRREEKRKEKKLAQPQQPPGSDAFPLPTSAFQPLSPERIHDLLPQLTSSPPLPTGTSPPSQHPLKPTPDSGVASFPADDAMADLNNSSPATLSFAEALQGKPPSVSPIHPGPVWQASASLVGQDGGGPASGEEESGGVGTGSVPSFQEAFTEALLTAGVSTHQGHCSKKTAKKGRKKLVLFSTGGCRGTHS